jgi:hypothetical protein
MICGSRGPHSSTIYLLIRYTITMVEMQHLCIHDNGTGGIDGIDGIDGIEGIDGTGDTDGFVQ